MRIGLIACCKEKRPAGGWPAYQLYTSPLFRKSMNYVQRFTHAWAILSARHGLVMNEQVIEPYDLSINDLSPDELRAWAMRTNWDIRARWPNWRDGKTSFVVIAGVKYRSCLVDLPATVPFAGLGIGSLMQAIDANLNPEPGRSAPSQALTVPELVRPSS